MKKVLKLLNQVGTYADQFENTNIAISEGSVGWHIEHSCLVIIKIIETIMQSSPAAYSWHFNFKKIVVFTLQKFPRGKAKAPKSVMPVAQINPASIQKNITEAKEALAQLITAQKNQFFTHPIFGKVNKKDTFKFLAIHTHHHVKIIQDILALK